MKNDYREELNKIIEEAQKQINNSYVEKTASLHDNDVNNDISDDDLIKKLRENNNSSVSHKELNKSAEENHDEDDIIEYDEISIVKKASPNWAQLAAILGASAGAGGLGIALANKMRDIENQREDARIVRAGILRGIQEGTIPPDEERLTAKTAASRWGKFLPWVAVPATGVTAFAVKRAVNKKRDDLEDKALYELGILLGRRATKEGQK